jgi:quercetin dioxygenase-like cupin family protein
MPAALTVIRHADRPTVTLPGGAAYQPIIGDDTGAGLPIRTGIQTSQPGYATPPHSHPYAEILTVIEGRGEAWLDGEEGVVMMEPGVTIAVPANRVHAFRVVGVHTNGKRIVNYVSPPHSPG